MDINQKISWFFSRKLELIRAANENNGRIKRQDQWRINYYTSPYLARATDEELFERCCDIFHNQLEINEKRQITPDLAMRNNAWMMEKWAHVMEEVGSRGGFLSDLMAAMVKPMSKYFESSPYDGVNLLEGAAARERQTLVRYSRGDYIERMYRLGEIRISPASTYADASLLLAQQDLELKREFIIPTWKLFVQGYNKANINGNIYDISSGDVIIREYTQDYYIYCMCDSIDRRLPVDFSADSALVIHDAKKFQRKFFDALRDKLKGWKMINDKITYYDPYLDFKKYKTLEMIKNLKYYYQKEFRLLAKYTGILRYDLDPFFIYIGSLEDISTPYYSKF